jgi:spermidine/putrescine transport system permease protein
MSTVTGPLLTVPTTATGRSKRRLLPTGLTAFSYLVIAWLFLPIIVMVAFSFNQTTSKLNVNWQGFTLHWYASLGDQPDMLAAMRNSLLIATIATVGALLLGVPLGMALSRWRFRGKGAVTLLLFINITTPAVTMGAALLSLFIEAGVPRGLRTIAAAHLMFCISFVAITVRARMAHFDGTFEEASEDLGASTWTTFRRVTLPTMMPAIIAAALLSFSLSIDDLIVTQFNAGNALTFPLWVYGTVRFGTPPQANVLGTLVFVTGLLLSTAAWYQASRKR